MGYNKIPRKFSFKWRNNHWNSPQMAQITNTHCHGTFPWNWWIFLAANIRQILNERMKKWMPPLCHRDCNLMERWKFNFCCELKNWHKFITARVALIHPIRKAEKDKVQENGKRSRRRKSLKGAQEGLSLCRKARSRGRWSWEKSGKLERFWDTEQRDKKQKIQHFSLRWSKDGEIELERRIDWHQSWEEMGIHKRQIEMNRWIATLTNYAKG